MQILCLILILASLIAWLLVLRANRKVAVWRTAARSYRKAAEDLADDLQREESARRRQEHEKRLMVGLACESMATARIFRSRALFAERVIARTPAQPAPIPANN